MQARLLPFVKMVVDTVQEIFVLETMTCSLRVKEEFNRKWDLVGVAIKASAQANRTV